MPMTPKIQASGLECGVYHCCWGYSPIIENGNYPCVDILRISPDFCIWGKGKAENGKSEEGRKEVAGVPGVPGGKSEVGMEGRGNRKGKEGKKEKERGIYRSWCDPAM